MNPFAKRRQLAIGDAKSKLNGRTLISNLASANAISSGFCNGQTPHQT